MEKQLVYLGLGGNLGDPVTIFKKVLNILALEPQIMELTCSPYYLTTPVSDIPQDDYINAVCVFNTSFEVEQLRDFLVGVEIKLGKLPKDKDAPRIIDIDILFFGTKHIALSDLEIPHPRWKDRLFVLRPLADLTNQVLLEDDRGEIQAINLHESLKNFTNRHHEVVKQLERV